jgi:SAM-dependent methyltransferase
MATATTATTRSTPTPTPAKQALHLAGRGWNKALWLLMMRMHRTHLTRYAMYQALATAVGDGPGSVPRRVLSISHSEPLCDVVGWTDVDIVPADFPDVSLLDLPYPDGSFDALVSDQVLEHVEGNPQVAIDESARVLAPGGTMIHTTCFMNPRHDAKDMWRFTPDALELLARNAGLDILAVDGWGNFSSVLACKIGFRNLPIPDAAWNPVHKLATRTHPDWMISTWLVARKPG